MPSDALLGSISTPRAYSVSAYRSGMRRVAHQGSGAGTSRFGGVDRSRSWIPTWRGSSCRGSEKGEFIRKANWNRELAGQDPDGFHDLGAVYDRLHPLAGLPLVMTIPQAQVRIRLGDRGRDMNTNAKYPLEPTAFQSMQQAQELADTLEENLQDYSWGAAYLGPELVEIFSKLVNNAAEHGMTPEGAHAHVRHLPHRRGHAFDVVVEDSGPGIRATLAGNPGPDQPNTDAEAIGLAVQELVSGTGNPTRGIGLWMTATEMRKPGRKLWIHSGRGLLKMYGDAELEIRLTGHRQGTMVRLTIPA